MSWRFREYSWRLLSGAITALMFAALLKLGVFYPLEQLAYNTLFQLRGDRGWDERLILVAIDDASIQQIGRFPWSRQQYARLIEALAKDAPSVIAIDLVFSESSAADAQLAQAMTEYGRVVLAQAYNGTKFPFLPVPELRDAAIASGHIFHSEDTDGITRKVPLQVQNEPALGLAIVQSYALVDEKVPLSNLSETIWINWPGSVQRLHQYSFSDVVDGNVPDYIFQDKIVVVGVTATGLDPLITPFDRNPSASGVHLQTAIASNLLQQATLQTLPTNWVPLVLLLGGPGLSLLLSRQNELRRVFIWVICCIGWGALSVLLFKLNYWMPVALPLMLITATAIATALSERLRVSALLRQRVQQLWQRHQQDLVIRRSNSRAPKRLSPEIGPGSLQSIAQLADLAEQLGRSQSAHAAIAHSLPVGFLAADLDGFVWFCNPVATDWLQIHLNDSLKPHLVPGWLSDEQWQADTNCLKHSLTLVSRVVQHGDRWFELTLNPLLYQEQRTTPNSTGNLDGFLLVLQDITTQKQAEETLQHQVQELQRLSQLKDDFLSTVSHELRSPMSNIQMAVKMLEISTSSEKSANYLTILQTECTREIKLINDLLDLQRLEAGAQQLWLEAINLNEWLPAIIHPFHERVATQQQTLWVQLDPHLPPLISDQASLERVLVELINNACKYTPPGGMITVSATSLEKTEETAQRGNETKRQVSSTTSQSAIYNRLINFDVSAQSNEAHERPQSEIFTPHSLPPTPHPSLLISVSNSGSVISAVELPRIFEKFYRVPQANPWKQGGTGLGLALVKKLVECLGGQIQVKSGSGETTFTLWLPLN